MSGETSIAIELAAVKKALAKVSLDQLGRSEALTDGVRLCTQRTLPEHHLGQLALLLVLLRQLRLAVPLSQGLDRNALLDTIRNHVAPALQPAGPMADLLITNVEHVNKAQQLRAADCIQAAARLATITNDTSYDTISLTPFFLLAYRSGLVTKPNIVIASYLLEAVPASAVPDDLLDIVLDGLSLADNGSYRANIVVGIMEKARSAGKYTTDNDIIRPILPFLTSSVPSATTTNMHRYLLPALFKAFPASLPTLLSMLASHTGNDGDTFTSWVSIASLGISLGLLSLGKLPKQDLHDALGHEDPAVRLKAYEMVTGCKDVTHLLDTVTMELVKEALSTNAILPGSGARSDFASITHVFFTNLKQAASFTRRRHRKAELGHKTVLPDPNALEVFDAFHTWFFSALIDPALISARRIPVYRPLLALHLLEIYLTIFGDDQVILEKVYTEKRVQLLIGCQASEFTEVRGRARAILKFAPTPLAGYPSIDSPNSRILIESAYRSFSNPRRTQNDAAVAGLCILFEKVLLPADGGNARASIAFVEDVVDKLDAELVKAEDGVKRGLESLVLHGLLSAATGLLSCVDLSKSSAQAAWRPTMHRLAEACSRVWQLTRTIMSLSTTSAMSDASSQNGPAHEIAKAYQILGGGDDEEEDGEMDTRRILSACWRATKEAGDLLSLITAQPILQGGGDQAVWTRDEVHSAGLQFLEWMHEIRHRGTFSKVALAFAHLVDAIKTTDALRDLAERWLELELQAITDVNLSTTRRSAALPYSLLSIVAGDEILLNKAIDRLLDLARPDNIHTADITRVHCFNILKIVLLDARQTKLFGNYFERTVMTAVAAFSSANWNVRNVGLILFSTLVHRSLTPSRGNQDFYQSRMTLAGRQTFAIWHNRYPKLLPYMIKYLGDMLEIDSDGLTGGTQHTPLFPMLIIIRSLQWSDKAVEIQEGLKKVVRPHLASPELRVREVAAQALSSLIAPSEAIGEVTERLSIDAGHYNAIHGQLLYTWNLLTNVVDWSKTSTGMVTTLEAHLRSIHSIYGDLPCPPIRAEVLRCIGCFLAQSQGVSKSFSDWATGIAKEVIYQQRDILPGADILRRVAIGIVLGHAPSREIILDLLRMKSEQDRLDALWKLPNLPQCLTPEIFTQVLEMATSRKSGDAVQIVALDTLASTWSELAWPSDTLQSVPRHRRWKYVQEIQTVMEVRCIPLKEAGLCALAWAVSWAIDGGEGDQGDQVMADLSREILSASDVNQSQPRRETAIKALLQLRHLLFTPSATSRLNSNTRLSLHQSLLRLLQDDDEDIRLIAADIIKDGLHLRRGVTQSKAVEAWWGWLAGHLPNVVVKEPWIRWLQDVAPNREDIEEDLAVLSGPQPDTPSSVELFAEEKPNLFRDSLDDAHYAAALLARLRKDGLYTSSKAGRNNEVEVVRKGAELAGDGNEISPIDDAFRVVGILPSYLAVLERAFSTS